MNREVVRSIFRYRSRLERVFVELNEKTLSMGVRRFSDEDILKLMTLEMWSVRYEVDLKFVVEQLLAYWRGRYKLKAFHTSGMGTKVPSFVGQHSEQILRERILRQYPDGENILAQRNTARLRLIALASDGVEAKKSYADPAEFVSRYRAAMMRAQKFEGRMSEHMKRRKYRGNPWC